MPNTEWWDYYLSGFQDGDDKYAEAVHKKDIPILLSHHRELIVKEMEEKLWIPCCHTSGMHDPVHFQNKKYICGDQVQVALHRFCTEMGINPKTKSDPNCSWCQQYPEKKNGEGLGLIKK